MRESGFYWVNLCVRGWTISEYFSRSGKWFIFGSDEAYKEKDFYAIGDKIEQRSTPVSKAEEGCVVESKTTLPSSEFFYNRAMAKSAEIKAGNDD